MKVAFCNEHAKFWYGGIRYILEVTHRLAKEYQVSLVVQDISDKNDKRFNDAGVEVLNMEETTASKLRYWMFYPYYLVKHSLILRRVQREYQFDTWISSSPTTHILCLLAGIKPILVVFELNPWLYNASYQSGLSRAKLFIIKCGSIVAKWLEKKAYQNAKRIIAYSKYIQSEIKRTYGVESAVVYTGVDSDFFKPTHNPAIEDRYKGKQVILHVASDLSPMKGTDLAVEAMGIVNKEFPDAKLVILNSNKNVQREYELADRAIELGADINFETNVKDADLPVYYTMAKCLLSPSLDENVHLPVLEAGCCECPTVCLGGNMHSEDVKDEWTGKVTYKYELADGVKEYLSDLVERQGDGIRARLFIKLRFNWDKCLSEYKRIIGEVVDK